MTGLSCSALTGATYAQLWPPASSLNAFVIGSLVARSFTFAVAVIGDSILAVRTTGRKRCAGNAAKQTAAIYKPSGASGSSVCTKPKPRRK